MKKLLLFPVFALGALGADAQLALQNFNSAGYAGWTMFNQDMRTISSLLNTKIVSTLGAQAWMKWPVNTSGDSLMITTSLFSPSGKADRWLVTPSFLVNDPNAMITWKDAEMYSPYGGIDDMEILISTTGGATTAAFTSLGTTTVTATGILSKKGISLSAYNGQNVKVAFRAISTNAGVVGVDDVQTEIVAPKTDLELSTLNPGNGALQAYGAVGSGITFTGTVRNNGTGIVTGYTIKYQQGSGPVVTDTKSGLSILPFATSNFTISTPYTLPSVGAFPVKVWVELTGDGTKTNDTANTTLYAYNTKPNKKILVEEGTGTWCGWCPRGLVYMDSIRKVHPNNFSQVAVQNGGSNPMRVAAYDAAVSTGIGGSYPGVWVDRREVVDPSELFDVYTNEKDFFGFADITVSPTVVGSSVTIDVTVKPHIDLTGDYRLAVALTEDDVKGSGSGYAQTNYYAGGGYGPMQNVHFDFASLPNPVPATTMHYDLVARGIWPSVTGAPGSLPTTLVSGTTYNYTFTGITLTSGWDVTKMRAVVMMLNAGAGGFTMNSENAPLVPASIANTASNVTEASIYPNPANEVSNIKFTLTEATNVDVQILDAVGKTVYTVANKNLTAGSYELPVNVATLASGVYMVKITTDKGSVSQRLSVVK